MDESPLSSVTSENMPRPAEQAPLPTAPSPILNQTAGPVSGRSRGRMVLIIVLVCIILATGGWYAFTVLHKPDRLLVKLSNSPRYGLGPAKAATANTPFGQEAEGSSGAAGIFVNIDDVIPNPPVTGDAPDAGTQYIEVDISAHNGTKRQTIIPGTFAYQTTAGRLLYTADSVGKGSDYPGKHVQLTGKEAVSGLSLDPGQIVDSHYLIYQVPKNEAAGKLIWFDDYYDTHSTRMAVFDLN